MELEPAWLKAVLSAATNLPRKTRLSTLTGRKNDRCERDPARVVGCQTAGGHHAVHMRMMLQTLIPGVEHAEEADLGAEVAGIASDLQQRLGAGLKQKVIDQLLVLECQRSQFAWQGEDDVDIAGGQQFLFAGVQPAQTGVALALWAVPVATRVIGDGRMAAAEH